MKLADYEITYMGSTFTIEELYKFLNDNSSVPIHKIGGLTYFSKSLTSLMEEVGGYAENLEYDDIDYTDEEAYKQSKLTTFYFMFDELGLDTFIQNENLYKRECLLPLILMYFDYFDVEEIDEDLLFNLVNSFDENEIHENAMALAREYFE